MYQHFIKMAVCKNLSATERLSGFPRPLEVTAAQSIPTRDGGVDDFSASGDRPGTTIDYIWGIFRVSYPGANAKGTLFRLMNFRFLVLATGQHASLNSFLLQVVPPDLCRGWLCVTGGWQCAHTTMLLYLAVIENHSDLSTYVHLSALDPTHDAVDSGGHTSKYANMLVQKRFPKDKYGPEE